MKTTPGPNVPRPASATGYLQRETTNNNLAGQQPVTKTAAIRVLEQAIADAEEEINRLEKSRDSLSAQLKTARDMYLVAEKNHKQLQSALGLLTPLA